MRRAAVSLETLLGAQHGDQPSDLIQRYLTELCRQLGTEVAYVAEVLDGRRVFRFVEGERLPEALRAGASDAADPSAASLVASGSIEAAVFDAREDDRLGGLEETRDWGIVGFAGVALEVSGRVLGALCTYSTEPLQLDDRQLGFLEAFGRLIADQLEHELGEWDDLRAQISRVDRALLPGGVVMVFQPIYDISSGGLVGAEALARFPGEPERPPNVWFEEAWTIGRGVDLELAAVAAALGELANLPDHSFLAINVSAETVLSPRLLRLVSKTDAGRVVLEIPERAPVDDHYALGEAIRSLRVAGARVAADDAGAGFESLGHILELRPEVIKFDVALTRDVDTDPVRRSLATSLVRFARQFDAMVVAEGIETQGELDALRDLGFTCGQGYFLARPGPLPVAETIRTAT
ncbi:MAG TPA: EAL domain-containing protein [Actinomycetota bacterium]|nr:EAL domain-containing protein [Actinomycetota bacterium]